MKNIIRGMVGFSLASVAIIIGCQQVSATIVDTGYGPNYAILITEIRPSNEAGKAYITVKNNTDNENLLLHERFMFDYFDASLKYPIVNVLEDGGFVGEILRPGEEKRLMIKSGYMGANSASEALGYRVTVKYEGTLYSTYAGYRSCMNATGWKEGTICELSTSEPKQYMFVWNGKVDDYGIGEPKSVDEGDEVMGMLENVPEDREQKQAENIGSKDTSGRGLEGNSEALEGEIDQNSKVDAGGTGSGSSGPEMGSDSHNSSSSGGFGASGTGDPNTLAINQTENADEYRLGSASQNTQMIDYRWLRIIMFMVTVSALVLWWWFLVLWRKRKKRDEAESYDTIEA